MIFGYGIVDKDNATWWEGECVSNDRLSLESTVDALNDCDDQQAPYRVVFLQLQDTLPSTGASMIADERQRQIEEEGWTPEHDDQHEDLELLYAAEAYMFGDPDAWPWEEDSFKPTSKIRDLVRAGALIAAEIDRLLRKGQIA